MGIAREFTYQGDSVRIGGTLEAVMAARAKLGSVMLRECGEMLHGRIFPLKPKGTVYKSCV